MLTKEQLDQILANQNPDFYGNGMGSPFVMNGMQYIPQYSGGPVSRETGGGDPYQLQSISAAENTPWYQGKVGTTYSPTGEVQQQFQVQDPNKSDWMEKLTKASLAAMFAAAGGQAAGLWNLGGSGAASGGLGSGLGGGAAGGFNAAVDSQLANAALGGDALAGYTAAGTGGITTSPIAATTGNSFTSAIKGLLPEGVKGWLGPAATLAGGLLGSKPVTQSQTQTRTTDPRFDPAISGLLSRLEAQFNAQPPASTTPRITPADNPFTRKR